MSSSTEYPSNVIYNEIHENYIPDYQFYGNIDTIVIQATMGIGKTNTLYNYLNKNINKTIKSCLIISFRVSLCEKYFNDLIDYFEIYSNINEKVFSPKVNPFVICQMDSIKRIRGEYDLVILDEISYSLSHLVTSVKSRQKCNDVLEELLQSKHNKIICLDALMNNDWIRYLSLFNRNISYTKNTYSIHKNKKIVNFNNNNIAFYDKIKKCLKNNENIVIASNSKEELRNIYNIIELFDNNIKKQFILKESKIKYDINSWNKYQVLAYSPTIVAGVSYTEKHFDRFFGIFCNSSATAEMCIQQMFRVRNINSNEYNICTYTTGKKDYPETDNEIKKLILLEDSNLVNGVDNITIKYIKNKIDENYYFNLYMIVQKLKFKTCNNINLQLCKLLKLQGILQFENVTGYDEKNKKEYNRNKRENKKIYQENEATMVQNALNIDAEQEKVLSEKNDKTQDEIYSVKKYKFHNINKVPYEKVTKENILKYSKKSKSLYNLARVLLYKDDFVNKILKRIEYEDMKDDLEDITYRLGRDKTNEKIFFGIHAIRFFGFKSIFDTSMISIDKNKFREYIELYSDKLEVLFKTNKFKEYDSYSKCKMFINSKLRSLFNISIVEDRKTKLQYIKGLDFWDDESVTYKNPLILNDLNVKETEFYNKLDIEIEEKRQNDDLNNNVANLMKQGMDIFEALAEVVSIKTDNINDNVNNNTKNEPVPKLNALNAFEQ